MDRHSETCSRTDHELALFVGGELDTETRAQVRLHLEACADCRVREAALRRARQALALGLGSAQAPAPDLWPGVRAALAREGLLRSPAPAPASIASAARSPQAFWRKGWAAAAAALIVLCAAWALRHGLSLSTDPGQGPQPLPIAGTPPRSSGPTPAVPVSNTVSELRRLSPEEHSLSEFAEQLSSEERSLSLLPLSPIPEQSPVGDRARTPHH